MPNWVYNHLSIKSPDNQARTDLREKMKNGERVFSFEAILPRPAEEEDNWYNWNSSNWGTKWDASDTVLVDETDDAINYSFSTAWSPPLPVLEAIARQYSDMTFTLTFEEEQGWGGIITALDTKIEVVKQWDIPSTHADILERGGECYCLGNPDQRQYEDCFYFKAKDDPRVTPRMLEFVKALSSTWEGTFEELISASTVL